MKIGYLVSQYPAVNHTYILREIRTLRALGFDVRAVSIRPPDRPLDALSPEEAEEAGQTVFVLGSGAAPLLAAHARTLLGRPLAYCAALWYALRLAGWDIAQAALHAWYFVEAVAVGDHMARAGVRHFHTHYASTPALIAARLFGLRFSLTIHGPAEFDDVAAFHMAEKVEHAVFVAAISRFAASQVMKSSAPRNWSKIRVLPLGVDPADLTPHHPSPEEAAPIRIVSVATLAPVKGFHILLAAAAILARRGRRLELTIVGDGPDRPALEEAIAKLGLTGAVHLAGRCNHDRVIDHYRAADIFALASFAEGVPVVLMEAMAMEIPCVATWITGIPELIRDGVDGLLGPPGDPETLADAIASLMDDPELRLRLGQSARRRIVESYDLKRNSNRLAEEFRRVAGSPGEPSAEQ